MNASEVESSGRLRPEPWLALIAIVLVTWVVFWWEGGCLHGSDVHARVTLSEASATITNLRLYAGGDKMSWPELTAGKSVRSALYTGGGDTQLLLSFTLNSREFHWSGPSLGPDTGYRIAVRIQPDGSVSERHCTLSCWFL